MSKAKFMPGPWYLESKKAESDYRLVSSDTEDNDCVGWEGLASVVVKMDGDPYDKGEANAHLIAAAPDLYHALEQCIEVLEHYADISAINETTPNDAMRTMMTAKDALAKARGET